MLRKRILTSSEGFDILGFDDPGSNNTQESSPNQEPFDSSDDFSTNKLSTGKKKMAQHVVSRVHTAPEEVFEQDHVIDQKYTPSKLKISIVEITVQFFICFLNFKTLSILQGK